MSRTDQKPWLWRRYFKIATEIITAISLWKALEAFSFCFSWCSWAPVFPVDQSPRLGRYKSFAPIKTECGLWRGPESFLKGSFWELLGAGCPASRGICLHRRPRRIHPLGVGGSHCGAVGLGETSLQILWLWPPHSHFRSQIKSVCVSWEFPEGGPRRLPRNLPRTLNWDVASEQSPLFGKETDSYRFIVPWNILSRHSSCSTKKKNTVQKKHHVGRRGRGHRLFDMSDMSLICQNRRKEKKTFILMFPFYRWANCGQKDDVCLRTSTGPEMASDEVFHRHFPSQMFICWWCPIEANYVGGEIKIWCLKPHMGNPVLHTQASFLPVDMLWS